MFDQFSRTELLLGHENMKKLSELKVAVFGIGGVGGYVTEALARSGIGSFVLVDNDKISETNINRQIIATYETVGRYKVDVMKERILQINPLAQVETRKCFFLPECEDEFDFSEYSYVVDAVDTVAAKLQIIVMANKSGVPVISSMGAGNKLNLAEFKVDDIYNTSVCPLARVMRHECRKRGIEKLKVVYSTEKPRDYANDIDGACLDQTAGELENTGKRKIPGSVSFVPPVAGLIIAGEIIKDVMMKQEVKS